MATHASGLSAIVLIALAGCGQENDPAAASRGGAPAEVSAGSASVAGPGGASPTAAEGGSAGTAVGEGGLGLAGGMINAAGGAAGGSSGLNGGAGMTAGGAGAPAGGGAGATAGASSVNGGAGGTAGAGGSTLSAGCGKTFTRPNPAALKTISAAGANRSYQFFVPATYASNKGYPLVITFHGGGGSAASSRAEMHLESATSPGLVVYLNYVNNGWSYATGSSDIAYYQAVRAEVESAFCVDLERVLVTGFSLGAIQTNGIGCTMGGNSVRAIVPIDGSGPNPQPAPPSEASLSCPAGTPVGDPAVMVIHGTNDTTALYKYGQWTANFWRKQNGCMATPSNLSAPLQGCITYPGCRAPVNFCTHSGNHEVPSTAGGWVWAFLDTLK